MAKTWGRLRASTAVLSARCHCLGDEGNALALGLGQRRGILGLGQAVLDQLARHAPRGGLARRAWACRHSGGGADGAL